MLAPLTPLAAYRLDVERVGRQELSAHEGEWLLLATILVRLASLDAADRPEFAARAASSAAFAEDPIESPRAEGSAELACPEARTPARLRIARTLQAYGATGDLEPLARDTQREVEAFENVGAFALAYTVLHALSRMLEHGPGALRGRTIAQMGRVARQAGALQQALDLYSAAEAIGRRLKDPDLICRAGMGKGVVANTRGNYPLARRTFERVLATARRHGLGQFVAAAHHGLMRGALAAGVPGAALAHGWEAFREGGRNADERADILANLAEACAIAGEYRAALAGYAVAAGMTRLTRIRLAALGGAVVAAASERDATALERLTSEAEREIDRGEQPYEVAQTLLELATAWKIVGSTARADAYRTRALAVAHDHGFTEVAYRAEDLTSGVAAETSPPPPLDSRSADVVRAIERLDWRAGHGSAFPL